MLQILSRDRRKSQPSYPNVNDRFAMVITTHSLGRLASVSSQTVVVTQCVTPVSTDLNARQPKKVFSLASNICLSVLHGKPRLPVLPFIAFCNHKLNETLCDTWAKTVRKTTVQKGGNKEQSSMTPMYLVLARHRGYHGGKKAISPIFHRREREWITNPFTLES